MIARALFCVFKEWIYVLISIAVALCVFVVATWLPNLGLIWKITRSSSVPLFDKVTIFASFVGSIATNFTVLAGLYTSFTAILFGINVAMVIYYVKQPKRSNTRIRRTGAVAFGGLASGFVGIGCAACGTLVLGPMLSLVGAAGLVAVLPFEGQEFGVLGVGMLAFSIFLIAKKIAEPLICPIVGGGDLPVSHGTVAGTSARQSSDIRRRDQCGVNAGVGSDPV